MISDTCSVQDAIVYKELEFWSRHATKEHDGHKWFYKSARELSDRTGLSEQQAKRSAARLAKAGIITRIHNPERGYDRTYWYRADFGSTEQSTIANNARVNSEQCNGHRRTMQGSIPTNAKYGTDPSNVHRRTSNTSKDTLDNNSNDTIETTVNADGSSTHPKAHPSATQTSRSEVQSSQDSKVGGFSGFLKQLRQEESERTDDPNALNPSVSG